MKGWMRTTASRNAEIVAWRRREAVAERAMRQVGTTDLATFRAAGRTATTRRATAHLSVTEAADVLGIKPASVRRYLRSFQLHGAGTGQDARVLVVSVRARIRSGRATRGDLARLDAILATRLATAA